MPRTHPLFRVSPDDPAYQRAAAAEAAFWGTPHPFGLEGDELAGPPVFGPSERHSNARYTGDPEVPWHDAIARSGPFHRALVLGTSALGMEARLVETNPGAHFTFLDISPGALARRAEHLGARFPGRVDTRVGDLNFVDLEPSCYDLIVSSGSVHHVTNLEYLGAALNAALTPGGYFFLQDYVGEPRFQFAAVKRRVFEIIHDREIAREGNRQPGVRWLDTSDLSPFCGVRSDEVLPVLRSTLTEVAVRTAGTLLVPMMRSRPLDEGRTISLPWHRLAWALLKRRLPWLLGALPRRFELADTLWYELILAGDVLADAGLLQPSTAFAIYRRR